MSWDLHFAPLLPVPVLIALGLLGAILCGVGLMARNRSLWLRTPFFALLILMLLGPSLRQEDRDPIPDVLAVVVDDSESQAIGARRAQADAALSALRDTVTGLGGIDLRVARTGTSDDTSGETRLFDALSRVTADIPADRLAGAVLITDGQIHDVPAEGRAGLDAPVHALITGRRNLGDRKLTTLNAPAFGIVGKPVSLRVQVDDLGQTDTGTVRLTVWLNGKEIQTRTAVTGEPLDLSVEIPHAGDNVLEVEAAPGPEELTLVNNRLALSINGVRDRLRVLLVSGEPHAGQRTWRNLLKSDPAVDLVHFTILRSPDKQDFTRPEELALIIFPTDDLFEKKLYEFDLIIFDRFKRRGVLHPAYLGNVARYVEQGGALLTAAGPAFATPASLHRSPLSVVFPAQPTGTVIEEGYRPHVTEAGARHPVTADLPGANTDPAGTGDWGRWFRLIDAQPLSGAAVMSGPQDKPLLILDRFGEGRVAQLMSDHAWLWARGYEGGGPQTELLRRLAHWLMKEPELEEEDLSATAQGRTLEIVRRSMADNVPPVAVTLPSGATQMVELEPAGDGLWRQSIETEEIGLHRLTSGDLTSVVAVGPISGKELSDVRPTADVLAPVFETTGGAGFWVAPGGGDNVSLPAIRRVRKDRSAAGSNWMGLVNNERYEVRSTRDVPVLPAWAWALLLVGSLLAAWRLEAR